ncbi:MAG: hypothetical protein ABL921_28235 [Pirellula sp.]
MQLIINHLTRMQKGFFCAAGIDISSGLHVRPILETGLRTELLHREGGLFDLGATLDFGPMRFVGRTPELEDRIFDIANLRVVEAPNPAVLRDVCQRVARNALTDIFSRDLEPWGTTFVVPANQGLHSLGCLWVERPMLEFSCENDVSRVRLIWSEHGRPVAVGVADIRLYEADHRTLVAQEVDRFQDILSRSDRILLSVGLSRPYRKSEDEPAYHWLQINNIHV